MLHYWHLVFARAIYESMQIALPSSIAITVGSVLITALLVRAVRGKEKFLEHIKASIGIAFGGAVLTWLLIILPWQVMRAPQLVQEDAVKDGRKSQAEMDRVEIKALHDANSELRTQIPVPEKEPDDSLRRRTFKLADEFTIYLVGMLENKNKPPDASPNSADPNPSEERKRAIQASQTYYREIEDYYAKHFRDRFVGIVKEYENRGVRTGYLANDFAQRVPYIPQSGSVMDGLDEISRFRDLAYHVDVRDHVITF